MKTIFPPIDPQLRLSRLHPPAGPVRMVLDTDTYNEIDDQFAVVYSLLSPDKLNVEALYAAPFHNARSSGPGDGMERSYAEIHRLLDRLPLIEYPRGRVLRGATAWMPDPHTPIESDVTTDLVERALAAPVDDPLYVVAIGAITNIASALVLEPAIREHVVVLWLGGHARHWPDTKEFNLRQDPTASRVLFESGVPLVQFPCMGVVSHLHTTLPEMAEHVKGQGAIGDYLFETFREYHEDHFAYSKQIWDLAPIGWLINPDWVPMELVSAPILTDGITWAFDDSRHTIASARHIWRDGIFRDLFTKLHNSR